MGADQKSAMDQDLGRMLDSLFAKKRQPALHLSQRFDQIINSIDLDAETFIQDVGKKAKTAKYHQVRCEFVRIIKALEQKLYS